MGYHGYGGRLSYSPDYALMILLHSNVNSTEYDFYERFNNCPRLFSAEMEPPPPFFFTKIETIQKEAIALIQNCIVANHC